MVFLPVTAGAQSAMISARERAGVAARAKQPGLPVPKGDRGGNMGPASITFVPALRGTRNDVSFI